jgi:hypothetical protein
MCPAHQTVIVAGAGVHFRRMSHIAMVPVIPRETIVSSSGEKSTVPVIARNWCENTQFGIVKRRALHEDGARQSRGVSESLRL